MSRRNQARDPASKLSFERLDALKHRSATVMRALADQANAASKTAVELAYAEAHKGILKAQTEGEIDLIRDDFGKALQLLRRRIDDFDQAFDPAVSGGACRR